MIVTEKLRIKIVRALLGLSQGELAAKLGVTSQAVCVWENGRRTPTRKTRVRLSQISAEAGIMFLPSGYPIPKSELMPTMEAAAPVQVEEF